jgi:hypothetical protein
MSEDLANGLSPEELKARVAVVKRFRELLRTQRDRFRVYLVSLDKQKTAIEQGSTEDILSHVEMEEKMLSDIFSIQKVINPLETMYRESGIADAPDVPEIQAALENLKAEASVKAKQNRDMLEKRMDEVRDDLKMARANPYTKRKPLHEASFVDMKG